MAALALRFFSASHGDRLLVINLGPDLVLNLVPEPLLAESHRAAWELLWSSESPRYGGHGTPTVQTKEGWRIPGHTTLVFASIGSGKEE
jgi:maltooligosyltrehalose trehalohydrolase